MTRTVTRTYHFEPLDHDRYQVWFVETTTDETRTHIETVVGIDEALRAEDAHKARRKEKA